LTPEPPEVRGKQPSRHWLRGPRVYHTSRWYIIGLENDSWRNV